MNLGLKVKHLLSLLALSILMACVPTAKQTKCASGEAYDPNKRTCVPSLTGSSGNTIFINSKSPSNSYAMSITGATVPHSVTVTDIYNNGYQTRWFVNFSNPPVNVSNLLVATGTNSFNFDPDMAPLLNAGAYTLEAIVYDASGLAVMDSESWSITVHPDDIPSIENIIPASPSFTIANDIATYTFQASAVNNDDQVGTYEWYLDGVSQGAGVAIPTGSGTTPVALNNLVINPTTLANGTHSVTLTFYDGALNVYDTFTWGLLVTDPELPVVASYFPAAPDILDAIDGVAQAANGYLKDNTPLIFTFTVDNFAKHPDGLEVVFNIDGGSVYSQAFVANTINVAAGLPAINLANSQIPETHVLEVVLRTIGSNRIAAKYQWSLDVRPTNTSPLLTIDHASSTLTCNPVTPVSGTSSTDFEGKGCTVAQDASVNVVLEIEDEDYFNAFVQDYTHFGVTFTLDGDNLDGTATLSTSNCNSVPNAGNMAAILTCPLTVASFNTMGPLNPGAYTLTATVVDDGSPYTATPANSNTVSWSINVTEINTAPVIQPQELVLGSLPSLTNSYFELTTSACTPTGSYLNNTLTAPVAEELGYVLIHTIVQDAQRDHFRITIDMENANPILPAGTYTNVVPSQTITRIDDTLNYRQTNCVRIPEWVRWSGVDGPVNIRVSIIDIPSLGTTPTLADSETFSLYVLNNNPAPRFTTTTSENPIDTGSYTVLAGYPFTLDPGSYIDTSSIDGSNITFQWQLNYYDSVGMVWSGWSNIDGADNAILTWTPSPDVNDGDEVELRLCLGDDGGNPNDCSGAATSIKTWGDGIVGTAGITINNNITDAALASDGEVATWFDSGQNKLYQVRLIGSSPTTVHVDKFDVDTTSGAQTLVDQISFTDENSPSTVSLAQASKLSVTGETNESLFISYKVIEGNSSAPQIRIRRVEIQDDNFWFSYSTVPIPDAGMSGDVALTISSPIGNVKFITIPTAGDTLTFNTVSLVYGADFCSVPCASQAATASSLVSAINLEPLLAGVTVSYTAGEDNFDINTSILANAGMTPDVAINASSVINNLRFLSVPAAAETLTINGIDFVYGTDFCTGACANVAAVANSLATAINASMNPVISDGVEIIHTLGTDNIDFIKVTDWCDVSDKVAPTIGDIKIIPGLRVMVPYTDIANNQQVSMFSLGITTGPISCPLPTGGHTPIGTGTFIQEIANDMDDSLNHFFALKNSTGNVDVHTLNNSYVVQNTQNNIFTMGTFSSIDNLSLSVSSLSAPHIFVTALFDDGLEKDLGAAIFDVSNLINNSIISGFTLTHDQVQNILNAKVIASETEDGSAQIAIMDSTFQTFITKLTMDISDYNNTLTFEDRAYPPLSTTPGTTNTNLAISDVYLAVPYGDDGATAGESTRDIIFTTHHPSDDAQTSLVNIQDMNSSETLTTNTGSYPAFLPSN